MIDSRRQAAADTVQLFEREVGIPGCHLGRTSQAQGGIWGVPQRMTQARQSCLFHGHDPLDFIHSASTELTVVHCRYPIVIVEHCGATPFYVAYASIYFDSIFGL